MIGRRRILRAFVASTCAVGMTAFGATIALWTAGICRFLRPNTPHDTRQSFKAGNPSDYSAGKVEPRFAQTRGIWIICNRYGDAIQIYALRTACTHLGCITRWHEGEQRFRCPCHGSAFTKLGLKIEGPAPRPLERCAIRLAEDGQIEIDPKQTFQHQLGQWNDTRSYLTI